MINFHFNQYQVAVQTGKEPDAYEQWLDHATFKDTGNLKKEGLPIYVGVGQGGEWYPTVIAFRSNPIEYGGFHPGILIVPETGTFFIGPGKVIRTYDLKVPKRKSEKELSCGFQGWARHDDFVVMQGELAFGLYSPEGREIWSAFVEPPWTYDVEENRVKLNVMGKISYRNLKTGKIESA